MLAHAQRQRLQPLQEQERIQRRHRRAEVAQQHHPHAQYIRDRTQRLGRLRPDCAVIAGIRRVQQRLARRMRFPIEIAAIDHRAADRGAVPADVFRRRIHHHRGAMLERLHQDRRRRVVHDQRNAELAPDRRDFRDRERDQLRIGQRLRIVGARAVIRGARKRFRIGGIDEARLDAQILQRIREQVPGAAIQVGGADDVVARPAPGSSP